MLDFSSVTDAEAIGYREQDRDDIIQRLRFDDALDVPLAMTNLDVWQNWCNDDLYAMDKALRAYFKRQRWRRERDGGFRTTASLVFAYLYGRKPTCYDTAATRMLNMLLRYYATGMTKGKSRIANKQYTHVYSFTKYATLNKRPYSLRLRMELAHEKGRTSTVRVNPNIDDDHVARWRDRRPYSKQHGGGGVDGGEGGAEPVLPEGESERG